MNINFLSKSYKDNVQKGVFDFIEVNKRVTRHFSYQYMSQQHINYYESLQGNWQDYFLQLEIFQNYCGNIGTLSQIVFSQLSQHSTFRER